MFTFYELMKNSEKWRGCKELAFQGTLEALRAEAPGEQLAVKQDTIFPVPPKVQACEWPCETFMDGAGIRQEFEQFVERAGLTAFLADKCPQYHLLTNTFVQNFTFSPGFSCASSFISLV